MLRKNVIRQSILPISTARNFYYVAVLYSKVSSFVKSSQSCTRVFVLRIEFPRSFAC